MIPRTTAGPLTSSAFKTFQPFSHFGFEMLLNDVIRTSILTSFILHSLLFPFIAESDFEAQLPRIKTIVGSLPKFQLKLHNMSFFKHGSKRFVLILKPEESVRVIYPFNARSHLIQSRNLTFRHNLSSFLPK